jgi:diaminopimelate decarboxylase
VDVLTGSTEKGIFDVVGPICESSDSFHKGISINKVERGDLVALRSAGAYGEVMATKYNLRNEIKSYFSEKQPDPLE